MYETDAQKGMTLGPFEEVGSPETRPREGCVAVKEVVMSQL